MNPLTLFETCMQERGTPYVRSDGSTNRRNQVIDRFNNYARGVALCSLRACEHGINLQTANHVLHVDFWWNPATKKQATDRVHRIGQDQTVHVHEFYVENNLEKRIKNLIEQKQQLADTVISDNVKTLSDILTVDELEDILTPVSKM